MKIKNIQCKSCMTKSKLTDYVINPYTGCQHGCKYCYATFIKKFQGIKDKWGDFVYAKVNCPELLEKELKQNKPGHIWFSSVTDPYLPLEGKYRLTRKILETIAKSPYKKKFSIEILTKSALIKRDFDLLKQLDVEVGCSVNTLDSEISRIIEPLASPPQERIKTLKEAKKQGIRIFGFISPVLPGITNMEELFRELKFCSYTWVELLNTKRSVMISLMPVIKKNFPDKLIDFEFATKNPDKYYKEIREQVKVLEKKYGLKVKEIVRHS